MRAVLESRDVSPFVVVHQVEDHLVHEVRGFGAGQRGPAEVQLCPVEDDELWRNLLEHAVGYLASDGAEPVLEDFLRIRFDCLPDLAPDIVMKSRGNEFLKSLVFLRDQHLLFTEQVSQLLDSARKSRLLCSLVPRLADREGHFARLLDGGDLTITLSLQMVDVKEPIYSRLSQLTLPMEDDATPTMLLNKLQEHQTKGRMGSFPHSI